MTVKQIVAQVAFILCLPILIAAALFAAVCQATGMVIMKMWRVIFGGVR